MTDDINSYLEKINSIFSDGYEKALKNLNVKNKNKTLAYITSLYRRWYYSSILENTYLTPANLIFSLSEDQEGSLCFPSIFPEDLAGLKGFSYKTNRYSLKEHPLASDFRIFLQSCHPDVSLTQEGLLTKEHNNHLFNKLNLWDIYYADYLKELALHMECIKNSPAIRLLKIQTTPSYEKLIQLSDREILEKMAAAALSLAASKLGEVLSPMLGETAINNFLQGMFQKFCGIDDVFDFFFSFFGINFKSMLEMEADEDAFGQFAGALQSSTFFLGITLDRYFFAPFGHYFKLIQPVYALPFDFSSELEFLYRSLNDPEDDVTSALYSPCTAYLLTPLGQELFHLENVEECLFLPAETKQAMRKLVLAELNTNALSEEELPHLYSFGACQRTSDIYEIKVKLSDNKTYWKNFELPGNYTLHDFFNHICFEFDLDHAADYNFFIDDSENRFTAYYSPNHKKRAKTANSITLEQLDFAPKHKFGLSIHNAIDPFATESRPVKLLKLDIEMLKRKTPRYDRVYPRVSRESQAFKELLTDLWF